MKKIDCLNLVNICINYFVYYLLCWKLLAAFWEQVLFLSPAVPPVQTHIYLCYICRMTIYVGFSDIVESYYIQLGGSSYSAPARIIDLSLIYTWIELDTFEFIFLFSTVSQIANKVVKEPRLAISFRISLRTLDIVQLI